MRPALALALPALTLGGLAGLAAPARADPSSPARADPRPATPAELVTDDCARARRAGKTCVLDVPAEDISGAVPQGADLRVIVPWHDPRASLIHLRRDFLAEIVKAAEDL